MYVPLKAISEEKIISVFVRCCFAAVSLPFSKGCSHPIGQEQKLHIFEIFMKTIFHFHPAVRKGRVFYLHICEIYLWLSKRRGRQIRRRKRSRIFCDIIKYALSQSEQLNPFEVAANKMNELQIKDVGPCHVMLFQLFPHIHTSIHICIVQIFYRNIFHPFVAQGGRKFSYFHLMPSIL